MITTMAKTATPRRSPLEESAHLADMVEDVSGEEAADELVRSVDVIMKEKQVPRAIAELMAKTGYSKGTAYRIFNDNLRRRANAAP